MTVNCCALSYARNVLARDGSDESLRDLVRALYEYNVAADEYFA